MRVSYDTMYQEFVRVLLKRGFTKEKAELSAKLYADASRDGVYTHGLNRFPKFMTSIDKGCVNIQAEPVLKESFGFFERYDGQQGPGNLNAYACMKRTIELAKKHTMGCVALSNTNHWMRPGNYGLMAVEENCIGILWTNTVPNMPPWGGREARLGNNPVVLAIPHGDTPVLVDVAMSMFSYGKLEDCRLKGQQLPVPGGYDTNGNLTTDPGEIEKTWRVLPMGYWKGSGISIALDLIATVLSNGNSVQKIGTFGDEVGLTQIMIAIDPTKGNSVELTDEIVNNIVADVKSSIPVKEGGEVYYPGELELLNIKQNKEEGIPVIEEKWEEVLNM